MKKIILPLIAFLVSPFVHSQENSDTRLFIDDVLTLAENFAQPAADAAGYQASAGWFSSATTLDRWEFAVSVHGNALLIPKKRKTFSLQNSQLGLLEIEGAESAELPTAFGGATGIFFAGEITNPINPSDKIPVRFMAFEGIGRSYVPHAFVQATVGLPKGTDLTVRAMPEVTIDGVTASTFGAGLKHNFTQYFKNNRPEDFQLAGGLAYSRLNVKYGFDPIAVEQYLIMDMINVDADLWMLEAIGSKRWDNYELFGAVGATVSDFSYEMGGGGAFLPLVNSEINKLESSQNQFKADLGFNFYVNRFRISAMATVGEFINANLGLRVRI